MKKRINEDHPSLMHHYSLSKSGVPIFSSVFKKYLHQCQFGMCWYCGDNLEIKGAHIDHIKPKYLGGDHNKSNLVLCCKSCNSTKGYGSINDLKDSFRLKDSILHGIISKKQMLVMESMGVLLPVKKEYQLFFEKAGWIK